MALLPDAMLRPLSIALVFALGLIAATAIRLMCPALLRSRFAFIYRFSEPILLLLVLTALITWAALAPVRWGGLSDFTPSVISTSRGCACLFSFGASIAAVVFSARALTNRTAFLLVSTTTVVVCMTLGFMRVSLPVWHEIQEDWVPGVWVPRLALSVFFLVPRYFAWILITALVGLYCVRTSFANWRFVVGCITGSYLAAWCLQPLSTIKRPWTVDIVPVLFALLIFAYPLQRQAFENLLGFSLSDTRRAVGYSRKTGLSTSLAHGLLLLLSAFCAFSAFVDYFESIQLRLISQGPIPVYHTPAQQNAWDDLKTLFRKPARSDPDSIPVLVPSNDPFGPLYQAIVTSSTIEDVLSTANLAMLNARLTLANPYLVAFKKASEADTLFYPADQVVSYKRVRDCIQLMRCRSALALHDGETSTALADMHTMLAMSALLSHSPNLVGQMIGVAVRKHALELAYTSLACRPNDVQFLASLATLLDSFARECRITLDYNSLRLGDPGFLEIVPNYEIMVAAFGRAFKNSSVAWIDFDMVRLAAALQMFKIEHAQFPENLDQLTTGYLQRLSREPLSGKNYNYRMTGSSFELTAPSIDAKWSYDKPLTFPIPN